MVASRETRSDGSIASPWILKIKMPELTDKEIDALVAEKVMGLPVCRCLPEQRLTESFPHYDPETGMCLRCKNRECLTYTRFPAAWEQVLDRMATAGWYVRVEMTLVKVTCCLWRSGAIFTERADTKGRAICLAALEAVKGKA